MTSRAKRLIDHATKGGRRPAAAQTYPSRDIRTYIDALVQMGFDREALLAAAGIRRGDIDDPDARITCAAVDAMFGHAVRQRPIKNSAPASRR